MFIAAKLTASRPAAVRILRSLILSAIALGTPWANAASIQQFQPQGRVAEPSRATVRFSADMVKLGDSEAGAPFTIKCTGVAGKGRWSDARTWSWQLSRPLQAGERCIFALKERLTAANGEKLTGRKRFEFVGSAPRPWRIEPAAGSNIEEDQVFIINAGGPVNPLSLDEKLWCEADGVGQRIPARLVSNEIRAAVLKHSGGMSQTSTVVSCSENLPAGGKMQLVWGKGIEAANGTPSDKEERFIYKVREPFKATLNCTREKVGSPCSPLSAITLNFNAPFDAKLLAGFRLLTAAGPRPPSNPNKTGSIQEATFDSVSFLGPLPQNSELTIEIPAGLKDDAGRPLANAATFPLKTRTGNLPPLAKFPGNFGIVELKEGGLLPVTLRNLGASAKLSQLALPGSHRFSKHRLTEDGDVMAAMQALTEFEQQTQQVQLSVDGKQREVTDPHYARELSFLANRPGVISQDLPKAGGNEFEVVGIPLGKPGYHIIEIESQLLGNALLGKPKPVYVRTAALVTNLAVHLKTGRDNALVWVTTLDSGMPVSDAEVRISGCNGQQLWQGKTDSVGRALVEPALSVPNCKSGSFLFASARLDDDFSFVRSDWNDGIEPWRFGVETWGDTSNFRIHSILDRSLFRLGQTVSMKHIARSRNSHGFTLPEINTLPGKLVIRHRESGIEFSQAVSWDTQGTAISSWRVPDSAKLGSYEIVLTGGPRGEISSGEIRVADFRLPVFSGSVQGVPARQIAPDKVPLALGLSFINGGAARNAEVHVSATLRPRWPVYRNYEGYNFQIDFDDAARAAFKVDANREEETLILDKQMIKLDRLGTGKLDVVLPARPKGPSEVYAEMSFADPNGEIQTLRGSVELWPANFVVGIKVADWASASGKNRVEVVVLDIDGQPLANHFVTVKAKRRIDYSHRRRIVGGFYAYENEQEYKDLGELCQGKTDSRGLLLCEPQITESGSIYLLAEVRDARGNTARASTSYWVTGSGDLWFAAANQDRIDVIPEVKTYKPGDYARFQVRTPFRESTLLISVEAGGILETFVQPLSRYKPIFVLPIRAEWGPNVFVSVLAVRGRVQPLKWYSFFQWGWREPKVWFNEWWNPQQPTAMVDLAKPAYRVGLAEIGVGTESFKLDVEISPDKKEYRPREVATVRIKVTTPNGKAPPSGTEVAFAAVDQALLEMRPNESWNLFDAMLQKRGYEVETATAQSMVIGKRHFGKKALPPGGGGGRAPARELFDTLLAWQPRVTLDGNGKATVKVTMNDSLSEFRLVGIATSGTGRFGTGSSAVRTRQDLQLISGLPPLVREGDRYTALLTLRNGSARPMAVTVNGKNGANTLATKKLTLDPEGAGQLSWDIKTGEGISSQQWEFTASEDDGKARDSLVITQQIIPALPVTVQQASFTRLANHYEVPVKLPKGALDGKGGLQVSLSARLATPPAGLQRFFEDYPYGCLEQKVSIAVGLNDQDRWRQIANTLPGNLDGNGLATYFPGGPGSATLTAYILDITTLGGFPIPEDSRQRMLQGLTAFAEGRLKTSEWTPAYAATNSLQHRRLNALEALTRQGKKPIRAAAALDIDPLTLPTAALIDWYLVVKNLHQLPQREKQLAAAKQALRNRLNYSGGRLTFTTERSDYNWWMMVNGDANAFRLIEATQDDADWQADLPGLMQGAMQRQVRGHWLTTTANAWARVTMLHFAEKFEGQPVIGTTIAKLGLAKTEFDWKSGANNHAVASLSLPWPAKPGRNDKLTLHHYGQGSPWASVQLLAAIPAGPARNAGYRVNRKLTAIQQKTAGKMSRGDLWRVTLTVDADDDMGWVALTDPIPAGAKIMGDGNGRDSAIASLGENNAARSITPSYVERSFSAYRAYYAMLPKGRSSVEYTLRLNNAGSFALPPTRVEAMYAPDVFGEVPNGQFIIVD